MPPAVRVQWRRLAEDVGRVPHVERAAARRWRLTVGTGRVRMTLDLKLTPGGRAVWAGSTLEVDGERRALADDSRHLREILDDPDRSDALPALGEPCGIGGAPPQVRQGSCNFGASLG